MEHAISPLDDETTSQSQDDCLRRSDSGGNVEMTDASASWQEDEPSLVREVSERPSNEKLLSTAFISFMSFTICQTVAAFIAGSEAMLGDSAAMFVDALTYLFNLVAERKKNRFDLEWQQQQHDCDVESNRRIRQRAKRKMTLQLELIPPLISVTTLIGVTIFVLRKAIRVLILDIHRDPSKQGDPNVKLMLIFSSINLGLDVLNVFCFAKARHLMGYDTDVTQQAPRRDSRNYAYLDASELDDLEEEVTMNGSSPKHDDVVEHKVEQSNGGEQVEQRNGHELNGDNHTPVQPEMPNGGPLDSMDSSEDDEKEGPNLNMCSAYTHVFADTLRSIAVIIAAVIAEVVDGVTPEEADATAAVVVSVLIVLSLIPLFQGLCQTFSELKAIRAEESAEKLFPSNPNSNELV